MGDKPPRLRTLGNRVATLNTQRVSSMVTTKDIRTGGEQRDLRKLALWSHQRGLCAACGQHMTMVSKHARVSLLADGSEVSNAAELDHIVPLHAGGRDSDIKVKIVGGQPLITDALCAALAGDNLQLLCNQCHREKTAREA